MASRLYELNKDLFDVFSFAEKVDAETVYFRDPDALIRQLDRIRAAVESLNSTKRKRAPNIDEKKIIEVLSLLKENPCLTDAQLASSTGLSVAGLRSNKTLKGAIRRAKRNCKRENIGRNIVSFEEL